MERGKVEQECFDVINNHILSGALCYGGSIEDDDKIEQLFCTAQPNPNPSQFPDFICEKGFIEHFEVTSSCTKRKGSTMQRETAEIRRKAMAKQEEMMRVMNSEPCFAGKSETTETKHSAHSYENFVSSFKKAWEHHIESYEKYDGDKTVGVFMVYYHDSALKQDTDLSHLDLKQEIYYGDLLKKPDYRGYQLTHDGYLLEYIYQFRDKIRYLAFYNHDCFIGDLCELICVENIPELLKLVNGKNWFGCAHLTTVHTLHGISVPNTPKEEDEDDDQT